MSQVALVHRGLYTAKGGILVASSPSTPAQLGVGSNGQVLTADSAEATGVKWATVAGGGSLAVTEVDGAPLVAASQIEFPNGTLTNPSGTIARYTPPAAVSPTLVDAKGDLLAGTANDTLARLGVGTDGQVLTADSAVATGVRWAAGSAGGGGGAGPWFRPGRWYSNHVPGIDRGTSAPVQNRLYASPFWVGQTTSFDRIAGVVTTVGPAASVLRLGIYNDSSRYPGTVLLDAGTITSTTIGSREITISQSLSAGLYWLALVEQGADGVQVSVMNGGPGYYVDPIGVAAPIASANPQVAYMQTGVSGALATFGASLASITDGPLVWLRAA